MTDLASNGTAPTEPDWTDQVTDLVVDLVDTARAKTTGPVLTASRAVVYGVVIAIVAVLVLLVGIIAGGRLLSLIPIPEFASYGIVGLVMVAGGFVAWNQRDPR